MNKKLFVLVHDQARRNAINAIYNAPHGYFVEVKEPTRSLCQNSKLWATLSDVSDQVDWHGRKLTSEEWKWVFTAALKKQDVVPGIDGGFVVLGQSTSRMTVGEMRDLIELISAFGAEQGVRFGDEAAEALQWARRYGRAA